MRSEKAGRKALGGYGWSGKPVCLGGGEGAAAGRAAPFGYGGKAFCRRAGVPFGKTAAMRFALTPAAGANCSEGAYPLRREEKNSGDICGAQLKGTEMCAGKRRSGRERKVLLSAHGGKAFLRRAGIPFGKAAIGFSLTLRRGGESVRQAVLCGSPNSARRAGAAVYAPKPQKRQRENKNPPLRGTVVRN